MSTVFKRIQRRIAHDTARIRKRLGVRLLGASNFHYWASESDDAHVQLLHDPLDVNFVGRAAQQLGFLQAIGLEPEHRFLDYGCSMLRTALYVVPFLAPGHYVGAEVGRRVMQRGVRMLQEKGIPRERYHLVSLHGPDLGELEGFRFDLIFANSVLQYLSDAEFESVMLSFSELLSPGGRVFGSFPELDQLPALQRKGNYYRTPEQHRSIVERVGLGATLHGKAATGFPTAPYFLATKPGAR